MIINFSRFAYEYSSPLKKICFPNNASRKDEMNVYFQNRYRLIELVDSWKKCSFQNMNSKADEKGKRTRGMMRTLRETYEKVQ